MSDGGGVWVGGFHGVGGGGPITGERWLEEAGRCWLVVRDFWGE